MLLSLLSVRPALRPAVRPPAAGRPHGASMSALALDLDERYAAIAEALPRQRAAYTEWVASDAVDGPSLTAAASAVGIHLDVAGGHPLSVGSALPGQGLGDGGIPLVEIQRQRRHGGAMRPTSSRRPHRRTQRGADGQQS